MSMVPLALRMSAVRALLWAETLAGDRVFDSAILPIDQLVGAQPLPFVVVSTETEVAEPSGMDVNNGAREIDLVIEIAMARAVTAPGAGETTVAIPDTDAGLELSLALLGRQVMACLFGRGGGAWGTAFRALASQVAEVTSRRGAASENGARFAARQMVFTIRAVAEPPFGLEIEERTPLALFMAAADADAGDDEGFASIVAVIRQAIEGAPLGWPEVFTAGAVLAGLSEDHATALGLGPEPAGEEPAPVVEVTIEPEGWTLDADEGEAHWPEDEWTQPPEEPEP